MDSKFVNEVDARASVKSFVVARFGNGDTTVAFGPTDKASHGYVFEGGVGDGDSVGLLKIEAVGIIKLIFQLSTSVFGKPEAGVGLGTELLCRIGGPRKS